MERKVFELWEKNQGLAEWEGYDWVDPPYCLACIISLEIDGFIFSGEGQITGGVDKEIEELTCTTPDGQTIKII